MGILPRVCASLGIVPRVWYAQLPIVPPCLLGALVKRRYLPARAVGTSAKLLSVILPGCALCACSLAHIHQPLWRNNAWVAQQFFWPCERRARFLANAGRGDTGLPLSTRRPGAAAQKRLLSLLAPIMLRVVPLNNVCSACNFFTHRASWLCCIAQDNAPQG